MGSQWQSVSLPPVPIRKATPEQCAESATWFAEFEKRAEQRARWRANAKPRTPEQVERKHEADRVRVLKGRLTKLRDALRNAAAARTYARFAWALDRGGQGWPAANVTHKLTADVAGRMEHFTKRAAEGCALSAEFIADAEVIALYAEARASMPADYLTAIETMNARATRKHSNP